MNKAEFFVVGVGASAGGHEALRDFFLSLPPNPEVAFVIVTHILRSHPSKLHSILSKYTSMKVVRIKGREMVKPNHVYVLPENASVTIKQGILFLSPRTNEEIINNMIDKFFRSLAVDQKEKAVGIIFSGMDSDGAIGAEIIHQHGGTVLVQEPGSTVFNSMPWAAITTDNPDEILPPSTLGKKLVEILRSKEVNI